MTFTAIFWPLIGAGHLAPDGSAEGRSTTTLTGEQALPPVESAEGLRPPPVPPIQLEFALVGP